MVSNHTNMKRRAYYDFMSHDYQLNNFLSNLGIIFFEKVSSDGKTLDYSWMKSIHLNCDFIKN